MPRRSQSNINNALGQIDAFGKEVAAFKNLSTGRRNTLNAELSGIRGSFLAEDRGITFGASQSLARFRTLRDDFRSKANSGGFQVELDKENAGIKREERINVRKRFLSGARANKASRLNLSGASSRLSLLQGVQGGGVL